MRLLLLLLAVSGPAVADEADDYFELGLDYLKTAFYADARAAFAESLVRAPGQAVPTACAAIASAAEGRDSASCAYLLRLAYQRVPARRTMTFDLRTVLRSDRDLRRLEARFQQRFDRNRGRARDNLTILAFLQAQDGSPETSPAVDALLKLHPDDAYAQALESLRPKPPAAPKDPAPQTGDGPGKGSAPKTS